MVYWPSRQQRHAAFTSEATEALRIPRPAKAPVSVQIKVGHHARVGARRQVIGIDRADRGKGIGQGTQNKLGFLPYKDTDFPFAVCCSACSGPRNTSMSPRRLVAALPANAT